MKPKGGKETNHAFRYALAGFGESLVFRNIAAWKLARLTTDFISLEHQELSALARGDPVK